MKKVLAIAFLIVVIYGTWWLFFKEKSTEKSAREEPMKVLNHSSEFNAGVEYIMKSYFAMKDAFVDGDTVKIKEQNKKFLTSVDSLKMGEINHDTSAIFQ